MKTFILKLLILGATLLAAPGAKPQNLLYDGNFSSTTALTPFISTLSPAGIWCSWLDAGVNVNTSISEGICHYKIAYAGSISYQVQLAQWGFPLILGHHYRLIFDVRADADRNFGVFIGEDGGLWTNLNAANYTQGASMAWQTKIIEFDATAVFAYHKLSFEMGVENINMDFDNIILEDLGPNHVFSIEIIGSSVPPYNWSSGVDLQTTDGVTYTLLNFPLPLGEVKFRQDHAWNINWGNSSFPTGYGYQDGPNIPVNANTYNIIFNRLTGQYKFVETGSIRSIGILGSALGGWNDDIDLQTIDGETYTLANYTLITGEAKFRQDNDWINNWGGWSFPSGYAYLNGPNIPVNGGTYNIVFNKYSGLYQFTPADCPAPVINCNENMVIDAIEWGCGAPAWFNFPSVSTSCGNTDLVQIAGLPPGSFYPAGTTVNTFLAINPLHQSSTCSFSVTVNDNTAPYISQVSVTPVSLWPPDHKMKDVYLTYYSWDNCGAVTTSISVSSNEPINGTGDGGTAPDWLIIDNYHLQLRAERSGTGFGRKYNIAVTSTDAKGNKFTQIAMVVVPQNMNASNISETRAGKVDTNERDGEPLFNLTVTPNPASQFFNLQITSASYGQVEIWLFDVTGRLVSTMYASPNKIIRFGDNLRPGIYIMETRQGVQRKMVKLVKQ